MELTIYSMKLNGYKLELTYNSLGFCVSLYFGDEIHIYQYDDIITALNRMDHLIISFYN